MGISGISSLAGSIGSVMKSYGRNWTKYQKGKEKFSKSYKRYKKFGIDKYIPDLQDFYDPPEKYSIKNAGQLMKAQRQLTELGEKLKADVKSAYDVRLQELKSTYSKSASKTKIGPLKDFFKEPKGAPTLGTLKSMERAEKKIALAGEYGEGYTKLKRIYGGYKKYGIEKVKAFEDFFQKPKRPTQGTLRKIEKTEEKIRAVGEQLVRQSKGKGFLYGIIDDLYDGYENLGEYDRRARDTAADIVNDLIDRDDAYEVAKEEEATLYIMNLVKEIYSYIDAKDIIAQDYERISADIVAKIIEDAVEKLGITEFEKRAKSYAGSISQAIKRLVTALYDEEYRNTKAPTARWKEYKDGANAYKREVKRFADYFDVSADFSAMGGNVTG